MEICLVLPVDLRWTILTGSKHPVLKALSPSTFQLGVPNGSRWLVGRVLSFRDRYPSLSVDFLFLPSLFPPTSVLLGKGRGVECKLGRVKAFFTQLRSASSFEPLSAAFNSGDEWNGYNLDPPCVLSESANKSPSSWLRTEETRKVRSKSSAKFSFSTLMHHLCYRKVCYFIFWIYAYHRVNQSCRNVQSFFLFLPYTFKNNDFEIACGKSLLDILFTLIIFFHLI